MNPYDILGLPGPCSEDELKKRYYELAQQHHPDKGGDAEWFKKINEAYRYLSTRCRTQGAVEAGLYPVNPDDLKNIVASFSVTMEDIKNGKEIPVSYHRRYLCSACTGTQNFGSVYAKCSSCMGRGYFQKTHHLTLWVKEMT